MLRSSLCNYSDGYTLVSGTITVEDTSAEGAAAIDTNIQVVFKNCAPFTDSGSEINNTQIGNAKYIDVIMPMYSLKEHSNNYSKISGKL